MRVRVLSLFDGCACGYMALKQAGIEIIEYYASEIDPYAIKIAKKNFPDIIHLGDVRNVKAADLPPIDLLIGGSPCQGFSCAGGQLNFDHPDSKLFFEYVRLLKECNPKYFFLENVVMKRKWGSIISKFVGVDPVMINSALVSAQNRQRLYWANWAFSKPKDTKVLLKDILEEDLENPLIYQIPHGYNKGGIRAKNGKVPTMTASSWHDNNLLVYGHIPRRVATIGKGSQGQRVYSPFAKSPTLVSSGSGNKLLVWTPDRDTPYALTYRKITPIECERLQTMPDKYTEGVSDTQRRTMLGNGWTLDVITHIFRGSNFHR